MNQFDCLFDFTIYYALQEALVNKGSMHAIADSLNAHWPQNTIKGLFFDNHDVTRFLNTAGFPELKAAMAVIMTADGVPFVYYGTEAGMRGGPTDEDNRECLDLSKTDKQIMELIKKLNFFRRDRKLWELPQTVRHVFNTALAYSRGTNLIVISNKESDQLTLRNHPYESGEKVCDFLSPSDCYEIEPNGILRVTVSSVAILVPAVTLTE